MALDVVGASSQSTLLAHSKAVSDSLDGLTDSQSGGLMLRLSSVGTSGIANGLADTRVSGAATDTLLMALDVVGPNGKTVGGLTDSEGGCLNLSGVGTCDVAHSLAGAGISSAATDAVSVAFHVVGSNSKTLGSGIDD